MNHQFREAPYQLARNPDTRPHELRLDITGQGFALYAFSFSSCTIVSPAGEPS